MRSPRRSAAAATALTIGVVVVTLFTVYAASIEVATTSNFADAVNADVAITTGSFGGGGSGGGTGSGGASTPQLVRWARPSGSSGRWSGSNL